MAAPIWGVTPLADDSAVWGPFGRPLFDSSEARQPVAYSSTSSGALVTGRPPAARELEIIRAIFAEQHAHFTVHCEAAAELDRWAADTDFWVQRAAMLARIQAGGLAPPTAKELAEALRSLRRHRQHHERHRH